MTIEQNAKVAGMRIIMFAFAAWALCMIGAPTAEASVPSFCGTGVSPYGLTPAQRSECGDRTMPLTRVEAMANGGEAYVYDDSAEGSQTTFPVPPPSFDALTATSQELKNYDIPTRPPLSSPRYKWWTSMAEHLHIEAPPPEIISVPVRASEAASANWSGYINDATSQIFKEAAAEFTEPRNETTVCGSAAAVTWVGLGGWNNKERLAQDGTSVGEDGMAEGEFWWEILPEYQHTLPMSKFYEKGGYATPGSIAYAEVRELTSTEFQFYVENEKFQSHGFTTKTSQNGYDGSTADYVVERPKNTITNTFYNLKNFGEVTFQPHTNGNPIESYGHKSVEMIGETGNLLARPGALSNDLFVDYHYNCK